MADPENINGTSDEPQLSLSTAAARQLATTTKSAPQMQGITSRWLLKILPWVEVKGGTYRVNQRLVDTGQLRTKPQVALDRYGQPLIQVAAGQSGEPTLPTTFVDYETTPREYELNVAQTILNIHTRVADLYNDPMDQTQEQLRLTIQALRERQEDEMINNPDFGLLPNADPSQRIPTRSGSPTPDDLDELLTRRRNPQFLLAHPRAIAAFGRECNRLGIYPQSVDMNGHMMPSWRGIPLLPCNKIRISENQTSSILVLRTGEHNDGVIGLRQTGIPDEIEPGLNVRFMGINEKAIISYLVSTYYSVAILVPDALGVLEDVEIGH